jgi:trimeric autotransporter adhesin
VATAGGVSVIHPWGAVADITPAYAYTQVLLQPNGRVWVSSPAGIYALGNVPYTDTNFGAFVQKRFDPAGGFPRHISTEARMGIAASAGLIYASGAQDDKGMSILSPDDGNPANGMIAYVTRDSATGWQPGDVRAAWLCDSTTGSAAAGTVLPDRSYKGRGLTVNGTLMRTALPCGLASVSGFSTVNYLEQAYNPDLDFGTGDFCVAAWVRAPSPAGLYILDRRDIGAVGVRIYVSTNSAGAVSTIVSGGQAATGITNVMDSAWHFIVAIRRAGVLEVWVDGLREITASNAGGASNTTAVCRVGVGTDGLSAWSGSIILVRVAACAPTPTQIRRMHEDERSLVVGGQPALLGGASNNVNALASAPDTGSLLVGTGDGISVFAGLARTAYHDGSSAAGAVASDSITSLSAMGPHLLVGTSVNAGLITDARIGRDLMRSGAADTAPPAPSAVTADTTPTDISPKLYVGEGETRAVRSLITARQYGTSAGQVAAYELRYLVRRDLGGSLALLGSASVTVIHESSAAMDANVWVDTAAQTVTERVTGLVGTRLVWTVERQVLPLTMGEQYAAK